MLHSEIATIVAMAPDATGVDLAHQDLKSVSMIAFTMKHYCDKHCYNIIAVQMNPSLC